MIYTAISDRLDRLYHWQRFDAHRLWKCLRERVIYCSDPASFNDPWDCKPHFNTEVLEDPVERERHVQWAIAITRRHIPSKTEADIAELAARLRTDRGFAIAKIDELSRGMWSEISARYRIYSLGPEVSNLLMWAHYADNHRGVCLEFATRDVVMCCALRVEYQKEFPLVRAYSQDKADNLMTMLAKADVWAYECEYRLISQERRNATVHETLMTDNNFLKLPETALLSVIVGCQGDYDLVRALVSQAAPGLAVKRARRVANRYELQIGE
jgi:hypothetical protein